MDITGPGVKAGLSHIRSILNELNLKSKLIFDICLFCANSDRSKRAVILDWFISEPTWGQNAHTIQHQP